MKEISNFYVPTQQLLLAIIDDTGSDTVPLTLLPAINNFKYYILKLYAASNATQRMTVELNGVVILPFRITSGTPIFVDFDKYPLVIPTNTALTITRNTASPLQAWCQYYLVEE